MMPDTTFAEQLTSQLSFYSANAPRTKADKQKIADQTNPLIKLLASFDKLAGQASGLSGTALNSVQNEAGSLLQQVMNQFGMVSEMVNLLKQNDESHLTEMSGALALDTVSQKQADKNHAFDLGYLDKVSLVLLTFQASVGSIQGLGEIGSD